MSENNESMEMSQNESQKENENTEEEEKAFHFKEIHRNSGDLREKLFKELNNFRINNEINSESVLLLKRKYNSLLISSKESLESLKKEEQIVSKKLESIEDSINKKVSEINTKKWCSDCNQLLTNDNQYYCCLSANYCSFEHKINHWHYHYIQCVRFNNNNNNDYNN